MQAFMLLNFSLMHVHSHGIFESANANVPSHPLSASCHTFVVAHVNTGAAAAGGVVASQTDDLTFLRGMVMTDSNGLAIFETIYPGRYTGRTPHVHVKVIPKLCDAFSSQSLK